MSEQMLKYWWEFVTDKDFLNVIESNRKGNGKNILLFNLLLLHLNLLLLLLMLHFNLLHFYYSLSHLLHWPHPCFKQPSIVRHTDQLLLVMLMSFTLQNYGTCFQGCVSVCLSVTNFLFTACWPACWGSYLPVLATFEK